MNRHNSYIETIAGSDYYSTKTKNKSLFPTLSFYFRLVHIFYISNRLAVKGFYNDYEWANSSLDTMHALENRGVRIEIEGMKNLRSFETAAIFVSNHMSTMETMILPGIVQPVKPVCFVMKEELVDYFLFGAVSGARDPILVGRDNPREDLMKVIDGGSERIKRGKSVIIFPQRTRSSKIDTSSFNTLGIKLAKRNNVPVIPIAVLSDAWQNGKIIKDFGKINPSKKVHIAFGEPVFVKGNGAEEHQKVIDFIKSKFISWGRPDLIQE